MKEENSRTKILDRIKENKPIDLTNIDISQFLIDQNEKSVNKFCQNLVDNNGDYLILDPADNLEEVQI